MGYVRSHLREAVVLLLLCGSLALSVVDHHEARTAIRHIKHDEATATAELKHTRATQKTGEPTGVCLREAMGAGLPVIVDVAHALEKAIPKTPPAQRPLVVAFVDLTRKMEAPLRSYVRLQEARYKGVTCPDGQP